MYIRIGMALLAAWLAAAQSGEPAVFFVSPEGNDAASGASPSEPWRSLARVQREFEGESHASGVEVRFARGGFFAGSLVVRGFTGARLRLTAYGEGAAPALSGTAVLDQWEPIGGGMWRTVCSACAAFPNLLLRDGVALPLARWPNDSYLAYESAEGRTQVTDEQLPDDIDWTGAEAVLRSAAWILDRLPVQRQAGKTLTFSTAATSAIPRGYGYFLQNHMAALDRDGEWVFDTANRTITVLLGDGATPDAFRFEAAVRETLVSISRSRNVEIDGLQLAGARRVNLEVTDSEGVVILGVESRNSGDSGVRCINCRGLRMEHTTIEGSLNHGLDVFNCTDCRVERNRVLNTATLAGMGRSGNGQYNAVRFGGTRAVFADNEVRRSGYLGVDVRGAAIIARNTISEFNLVKTDGGGIYTWGNRDVDVIDNLVRDGQGSRAGVPWSSNATHGIYIDDQSEAVRVHGNTVLNVASYGIYLHNTRQVEISENTVAAAGESQIAFIDDNLGSYTVSETAVRDNVFAAAGPGVLLARASTTGPAAFFTAIGSMSGNRYCNPFGEPLFGSSLAGQPRLTPSQWQELVGGDTSASICQQRLTLHADVEPLGSNRVQNGTFDRDLGGWFGWPSGQLKTAWSDGRLELRHTGSAPTIHYDTPIGAVDAGTLFRVRFDAHSEGPQRWLRVYLRKWDADYRRLGESADVLLSGEPRSFEFFIPATQSEARSLLIFELPSATRAVWLDNVSAETVRASSVSPADLMRIEVNPSTEPRQITLDVEYTDVTGRSWPAGSAITLEPFRSVVLFRPVRN